MSKIINSSKKLSEKQKKKNIDKAFSKVNWDEHIVGAKYFVRGIMDKLRREGKA
ncbi:MAG: hypothetical protein AAB922_02175 [Patescibacteria group bacterium]|mgnify:CR=1 FL=1